MEYGELFKYRIQSLCKERGLTINKLAVLSGIGQSTLDNIMQGISKNPTMRTIHKIANTLNMTPAEFLDFSELNAYSFED